MRESMVPSRAVRARNRRRSWRHRLGGCRARCRPSTRFRSRLRRPRRLRGDARGLQPGLTPAATAASRTRLYAIDYTACDWSGNLHSYPLSATGAVGRSTTGPAARPPPSTSRTRRPGARSSRATEHATVGFLCRGAACRTAQQALIDNPNKATRAARCSITSAASGPTRGRPPAIPGALDRPGRHHPFDAEVLQRVRLHRGRPCSSAPTTACCTRSTPSTAASVLPMFRRC